MAELEAIEELLDGLERGPRALFLLGPAGIGKTQLWSDGVERARSTDLPVCTTRPARADAQAGFAALRDLVGTRAEEVLPELPVPQRRALAVAMLLDEPGPDGVAPDVVSVAFTNALRALSKGGPLLVAIDDAQWVDATSRAALAFAFRRLDDEPIGLLATVRVEPTTDVDDLLAGPTHAERRDLGALTIDELNALVRDRTGRTLRRPTLLRLHELSGGNPYFALELVRTMSADEELRVPSELAVLLQQRLSALSPSTQRVLLAAAALAEPTRDLLAVVDRHVGEALAEAVAADVIEGGIGDVRFTHPLLGSVCYSAAAPEARRDVHRRLATAVSDPVERAHHVGLAVDRPDKVVARELAETVALARRRGAVAAAADLAELAVSVTPESDADRIARVIEAAQLRHDSGDIARAERMLAEELEREIDDEDRAVLRFTAGELAYEHDQVAALEHFQYAVEHAGDDQVRVNALGWISDLLHDGFSGEAAAIEAAAEAVRVAERTGDSKMLIGALRTAGQTYYRITGELHREMNDRALALARTGDDQLATAQTAVAYANTLADAWELDDARQLLEPLITRSRARGSAELAGELDLLSFVEMHAGNLGQALPLAREAVELAGQTGRLETELYATIKLAWIEGLLGDVDRARETCERAIRLAEQGAGFVRGGRLSRGYLESSLEDYETAFAYLDPADPRTGIVTPQRPVVHIPELIEVLVGLGRLHAAREHLEPYEERAVALDRTFAIARVAHCRSLILAAEGDLAGAEVAATRAVTLNDEHGWAVHLGRSLLALGSVQRRRGHKAEARATLERAVAVLDDAGAAIWCERARRELGRIGGRSTPSGAQLSVTETRVAELVAAGRSNAEVAAALHVSRKTVEWNLSKVYRKLGVRSRTELAARGKSGEFPG